MLDGAEGVLVEGGIKQVEREKKNRSPLMH